MIYDIYIYIHILYNIIYIYDIYIYMIYIYIYHIYTAIHMYDVDMAQVV